MYCLCWFRKDELPPPLCMIKSNSERYGFSRTDCSTCTQTFFFNLDLSWIASPSLWWVGSKFKLSSDVEKRTGLNMEGVRDRRRAEQHTDSRRKRKDWSKRTLQTWSCIPYMGWSERDRETERGEEWGEGGGGWTGGGWQERKFNLAPDSISIPGRQPHKNTHTKYRHYVSGTEVLLVTSHRPKLD